MTFATTLNATLSAEPPLPFASSYDQLTEWRFPVFTAIIYFLTVKSLAAANSKPPMGKHWTQASWFKAFVVLHNAFLAVFSAVTFVGISKGLIQASSGRTAHEAFCDHDDKLWNGSLGYWAWLFYLSKYYEMVDTAIILLKGRKPSLLQSYHHAGAILSMWLCVRSHAAATWIFVLFNSFIHTLMYSYYILTTMGMHPQQKVKKTLTRMQIIQFLTGGTIAASYPFIPGCLKLDPARQMYEKLAYAFVLSYLAPLVYLFVDFAQKVYGGKMNNKAKTN
ncbi:very-long-chain 3-oxoacyl-CoA synthase [Powellomyces hirtus]|uniref:Elongation of fatty acids protein n=1 Tax=Powellomyces hirtus TaxID=109895 RepID=A0A507E395_9FUNG|nr:very-long-chain 3-oxoacyl-CoA synthase [Powellomyces hirtus]